MASSNKVVEVLCPNGRRHKIKTKPSMTVLQILEEVCKKAGLDDTQYDIKHLNKVLPLTSIVRFLNFTNNAKLELIEASKIRKSADVKVAIQLENGTRYQQILAPDTTLHQLLLNIEKDIDGEQNSLNNAVCVYMGNEYKTLSTLKSTTLKEMGVVSGGALIRLIFREDIDILNEEEKRSSNASSKEESKEHPADVENQDLILQKEPILKKAKLETEVLPSNPSITEQTAVNNHRSVPVDAPINSPYTSAATGPPSRQIFPDDPPVKKHTSKSNGTKEQTLEPFHQEPAMRNEFANFKFPDKAEQMEDIAIDPQEIKLEVQLAMACNREPILYDLAQSEDDKYIDAGDSFVDMDDNFFNVTIDDLRKRMTDLKSNSNSNEEELLMTKAMRKSKYLQKASQFEKIPIRFQFPNKIIIQGLFRPLETMFSLKEFIEQYLDKSIAKDYELFTTPPRIVLKGNDKTLYDAKLFPAALVHISFKNNGAAGGAYLQEKYMSEIKPYDEVKNVLFNSLRKASSKIESSNVMNLEDNKTIQSSSKILPSNKNGTSQSSMSSTPSASVKPKNAPKWFKTGR